MSNARLQCWLGLALLIFAGQIFSLVYEGSTPAGFFAGLLFLPTAVILSFMFSIAVGLRKDPTRNEIETDEESGE